MKGINELNLIIGIPFLVAGIIRLIIEGYVLTNTLLILGIGVLFILIAILVEGAK